MATNKTASRATHSSIDEPAVDRSSLPQPQKPVGALTAGLSILRYLANAGGRVGVTRVARDLELNSSTCFNLLRTLVHEGLVSFDLESKTYALDLGLVELAKGALEQASYARLVRPSLEAIAVKHHVTAMLWQRSSQDRVVLVERAESGTAMHVHMSIGQRLPMLIGALGRCVAAHAGFSRADLRKHFRELRWENPPSFEEYLAEVERAQTDGYAIDSDNYVRGVTTVAGAILNEYRKPIMAISAVGFSAQFNKRQLDALAHDMRTETQRITRILSGKAANG